MPYIEHAALPTRQHLRRFAASADTAARAAFRMSSIVSVRLCGWLVGCPRVLGLVIYE